MARHARRLITWIGGGILALVLLAVAAVVALVWLVDPNVYKPRIATAATQSLGRPVTLAGDLRWSIGWDIGIESADGTIGNAPGFDETPFARWRALRLGLDTRALLRKRVVIDRLELIELTLNLERNAAGEGNWTFPARKSDATSGKTVDLQVASIHLRDSKLTFTDAQDAVPANGSVWQADDVSLDVDLPADLKAQVRELRDVSLSGRLRGEPLPAAGVAFAFEAASVQHDAVSGTLDVPRFRATWMEAELTGNVQAAFGKEAGESAPSAQGKLVLRVPSVRQLLASLETTVPPMADPGTLGRLEVESGFQLKDGVLSAPDLQAKLDDTVMSGSVAITGFSPLALRFDLYGDVIDLDRYLQPADYEGKPMELPLPQLKALDARGVLRMKSARVAGATAEELRIDVQ
jgi:AsmA protein